MADTARTDGAGRRAAPEPPTASVALRGVVATAPRCIRTAEGWEIVGVVLGAHVARPRRGPAPRGSSREPEGAGLLAVCSGAGAFRALAALDVGDEVVVQGRLATRRAVRPEDDTVELVAEAVLVRSRDAPGVARAAEPRIGR